MRDIPGVIAYIDDVLITGEDEEKHLQALEEVLRRFNESGLRLHREKCFFLQSSVEYLGFKIDAEGVHPLQQKVEAIVRALSPRDETELKAYLGLLSYHGHFLPNLSTLLPTLYWLLKAGTQWHWSSKQKKAFHKMLTLAKVLAHYDPSLELVAGDTSVYGLGAVLSQVMPGGEERPVVFAS